MTRVLLITTGGTPQLVTETIYALLRPTDGNPWVPDRIVLATTSKGEKLYRNGGQSRETVLPPLLGKDGRLFALYRALGLEADYVEADIAVAKLPSGEAISDIRSPEEVSAYAELLLERVRAITADQQAELHLSIAGGRKTMSFIAGQVMTLCARAGDSLSHCLVHPEEMERRADFWWPGNDGMVDPVLARIDLHPVPFLRLGAWLDANEVFAGSTPDYDSAVDRANARLSVDRLEIDLLTGSLRTGANAIDPPPSFLAPVALIALAAKQGRAVKLARDDRNFFRPALDGDIEAGLNLWAWLRAAADLPRAYGGNASLARQSFAPFQQKVDDLIRTFDDNHSFRSPLSHVRKELRDQFGRRLAEEVVAPGRGQYATRFSPDKIDIFIPPELADHPDRPAGTFVRD